MKYLTSTLLALLVAVAPGCKKKEDKPAEPAPSAPAGSAPAAAEPATATPAAGDNAACKLIAAEKLGELAGMKFDAAMPATVQGETSACGWKAAGDGGGSLSIAYYQGNAGKEAWKNMAGVGGDPVAGVGDEAFASDGSIRVRKGDNVVDMNWRGEVTPEQQKAVAAEVASKM